MRERIAAAVMTALVMTGMITVGYITGYLHATSMPENAAPGFMLGFTVASVVAVPAIYVLKNGVPVILAEI